MTCVEHDEETFRLIRRHERELDRWFTQRLGYRLHIDADTARLFKIGVVPDARPLRTASERPFHQLEYTILALVLASTAAGPAIISLRDLVADVRSAAAEADVPLIGDATERRAIVSVLRWMIRHGLAIEMHEHVDAYATDEEADAVLRIRPDRIALLPVPALIGAEDPSALLEQAERRGAPRQWMRGRLVEDPVLYRSDLSEAEWSELRRRLGEEERILDEMFGLVLEARAEGVAAIDPTGSLADRRFPGTGTVGHAALLLVERLSADDGSPERPRDPARWVSWDEAAAHVAELARANARRWSNELVAAPDRLARQVMELLVEVRLAEQEEGGAAQPGRIRLLPAAVRFVAVEAVAGSDAGAAAEQRELW